MRNDEPQCEAGSVACHVTSASGSDSFFVARALPVPIRRQKSRKTRAKLGPTTRNVAITRSVAIGNCRSATRASQAITEESIEQQRREQQAAASRAAASQAAASQAAGYAAGIPSLSATSERAWSARSFAPSWARKPGLTPHAPTRRLAYTRRSNALLRAQTTSNTKSFVTDPNTPLEPGETPEEFTREMEA